LERDRSAPADHNGLIDWDPPAPEADGADAGRAVSRRDDLQRKRRLSRLTIAALAAASAVGGALAGCHPTGTQILDPFYAAAAAALVTLAASKASRSAGLILATVAAVFARDWLLIPAAAALGLAFVSAFLRRPHARLQALIGALSIQVMLRWPHIAFHGFTVLAAVSASAAVLISAWRRLPRKWRRRTAVATGGLVAGAVVLSAPFAVGALAARHSVASGVDAARSALTSVSNGDSARATAQLQTASAQLGRAQRLTGAWWTAGGLLVPGLAQQRRAVGADTGAAAALTSLAGREADSLDYHTLGYHQGRLDLQAVTAMTGPLVALDRQIAAAQATIRRTRSDWLVAPLAADLRRLSAELDRAGSSAHLAVLAAREAPALLGADGVRHYFLAFMTPAETRGLDGFIGAYGELTADNGRITLTRAAPITALNASLTQPPQLAGVSEYQARYGAFDPAAHFQDVTYSPDLPTVTRVIAQMYPAAGGGAIDGVLAIDPVALSRLLQFTGPLNIAGLPYPLTEANATDVLLRQQYSIFPNPTQPSRDAFLQQALSDAFRRLSAGSLPGPTALSSALDPVVREGRLLFWSTHPGDQPLIDRLGLDGSFPQPGPRSDCLAVAVANAGNNKIDAYLHEAIADRVAYNPSTGRVTSTVTVKFTNQAPTGGLPDYVIGVHSGPDLPPGTNFMWVSFYSPLHLTSSLVDGSVAALSPPVRELGSYAYSGFLAVPSGGTTTVTLSFEGDLTKGPWYRMALRLQPLANPPSASITVGQAGVWSAGTDEVQTHSWKVS
jgi:hypothetical protein